VPVRDDWLWLVWPSGGPTRRGPGDAREVELDLTEEFRRRAARDVRMQHLRDLRRLAGDLHEVQPPTARAHSVMSARNTGASSRAYG